MRKIILLLVIALACIAKAEERPNILFIIADDQSPFDLKMYNPDSILETPVLDKLASEGMILDGAYHMGSWSGAVCTPSRHMIMTGRTLWHLPLRNNQKVKPTDILENTIAAIFNRAGYDTMRTCKAGNSYGDANEKFTVRHDSTKRGDTDQSGSGWHAERVLDYLNDRQANNDTDPFMIYYGFSHPHDTRNGKPELLEKYGATNHTDKNSLPAANAKQPTLPTNYLPAHPFPHGHPGMRDEVNVSGVWENRDENTIRNELGREFACSENIDIQIGRVLEKLEEMGEIDNTYIFYTADHGMAIGRHGLQGKQNLYEHTWRVPYIVKGPGIEAGTRSQGNIYLLDVLGTICDLAGIEKPSTVESTSFKDVLEGKTDTVRDVLFGTYCGGTKPGMRCVRKGDWKLIKYDVMDGTVRQTQLFNLKDNPDELIKEHHAPNVVELIGNTPEANQVNLAGDSKYADKLAEMEALLLSEMRRADDPYRLWDQPAGNIDVGVYPALRQDDVDSVIFSIDIQNQPAGTIVTSVEWYMDTDLSNSGDEILLSNSSKYVINTTETDSSLTILNIEGADEGYYYSVVTLDTGASSASSATKLSVSMGLVHRWSFSGDLTDSVSGANGTLYDPASHAYYVEGNQLFLDNPQTNAKAEPNNVAYVELPDNIVSLQDNYMTIEMWLTPHRIIDPSGWIGSIFAFGQDSDSDPRNSSGGTGLTSMLQTPESGPSVGLNLPGARRRWSQTAQATVDEEFMLTLVWDGNASTGTFYIDGVAVAGPTDLTVKLSDIVDVDNLIGHNWWSNGVMNASINEIRIYDWAYETPWIEAHYKAGADVISVNPCMDKPEADLNDDCVVDLLDLAKLASGWVDCGRFYPCN
jgi:choline-sulfatase